MTIRIASVAGVLAGILSGIGVLLASQDPPVFRSATELLTLDVWVTSRQGRPVPGLAAGDFVVQVDGKTRVVRLAEYVEFAPGGAVTAPTRQSGPLRQEAVGRTIALIVDDLSFERAEIKPMVEAAARWVTRLQPDDQLVVFRTSGDGQSRLTRDHSLAIAELRGAAGQMPSLSVRQELRVQTILVGFERSNLGLMSAPEALCEGRIRRGAISSSFKQECMDQAPYQIREEAYAIERSTLDQVNAYTAVLRWLQSVRGPRSLVILSSGLPLSGGLGSLSAALRAAEAGGTRVYGLTQEVSRTSLAGDLDVGVRIDNESFAKNGLDEAIDALDGQTFRAPLSFDSKFDQISSELSGVYRLGVEIPPDAPLPASVPVKVSVRRDGLNVRTASKVLPAPSVTLPQSSEERVRTLLAGEAVAAAVPLEVSTALSRDASGAQIRVTTTVSTSSEVKGPVSLSFAFENDATKEVRTGQVAAFDPTAEVGQTSFAVSVPAGRYHLRVVAQDAAGNVGSAERGFLARLRPTGPHFTSELQLRWKGSDDRWRVLSGEAIPPEARALGVGLEIYPDAAEGLPPELSLVATPIGAAVLLVSRQLSVAAADGVWRVGGEIGLGPLKAGEYRVGLTMKAGAAVPAELMTRLRKTTPAIEVATVAAAPPIPPRPSPELVLRSLQDDLRNQRPTVLLDDLVGLREARPHFVALAARTRQPLPPALLAAQDDAQWGRAVETMATASAGGPASSLAAALMALRRRDSAAADAALVRVLAAVPDSTAVMLYMGAAHALAGRNADAIGAWQMASTDPTVTPVWHSALAAGLASGGDLPGAIESLQALPPAVRTAPPVERRLVLLLVAAGRVPEARAILAAGGRALVEGGQDEFQFVAVVLALADALAPGAQPDAITAFRSAADRYVATGGAQADVVRRWIEIVNR